MAIRTSQQRIIQQPYPNFAKKTEEGRRQLESLCHDWVPSSTSIAQGFTYLGQFLAHDTAPRDGENRRSWKLDLDSVYTHFGDEQKIDQASGRFRTTPATEEKLEDLLRDPCSQEALIPEFRNDDQLIIAQLHLAIQKFHNVIVNEVRRFSHMHYLVDSAFVLTREYVKACIQRVTMDEYLRELCDEAVYEALWVWAQPSIIYVDDGERGLPFDISHAAGRFGHSQVRDSYTLNSGSEVSAKSFASLVDLFMLSRVHNPEFAGVPKQFEIDWRLFFPNPGKPSAFAKSIDPIIASGMLDHPSPNMFQKNLLAGIRKELPPGQAIAQRIIEELNSQQIDTSSLIAPLGVSSQLTLSELNLSKEDDLKKLGFWDATPLWLYLLIEADGSKSNGLRLGPLGSILALESFKNSIRMPGQRPYKLIQASFERAFPGVKPVRTMHDLLSQIQST